MAGQREGVSRAATTQKFSRQVDYIKVNGFPGGLCSDLAEVTGATESLTVRAAGRGNGGCWEGNGRGREGTSNPQEDGLGQELVVQVPYAGTNFSLRLLFYPQEPWVPPDIFFADAQFSTALTVKDLDDQVPSLNEWNCSEEDIIAQLLHQLLQLYKRYQLERLETDEVLQFHYQSLLKVLKIGDDDIEVCVNSDGAQVSSLLLRLPLSLQDVPPVLVDANPGAPVTLLQVTFQGSEGLFIPKLHLSPRVEGLIGGASSLALPSLPPGTCLTDYVECVMQLLEEKVRKAVLYFETRKQFIAEMLCQFGCAVLEYDAERFTKIVLMLEVKDFHFLAFLHLGPLFPQQAPRVMLQSLYHNSPREPFSQQVADIKHSPQMKAEEMVHGLRRSILAAVSSFQLASIRTA